MTGDRRSRKSEQGLALIITLVVLVLITTLVTEFSYGVFTTTSALHNWEASQRLSLIARSGVVLAMKKIPEFPRDQLIRFTGRLEIPVHEVVKGIPGSLVIIAEDESAKFNLNTLTFKNFTEDTISIGRFKRLLKGIDVDEMIADRIVDWMDGDNIPRQGLQDSEVNAKNGRLDSVDELLQVKGIDRQTYDKLLPYVTVYPVDVIATIMVNINTAPVPVIMSITDTEILAGDAEKIVASRPFTDTSKVTTPFQGRITVTPAIYRLKIIAGEDRIKRIIECVVSGERILYWKET